jgi:Flp pilus assembly protein TadD
VTRSDTGKAALLLALTVAVYLPVWNAGFIWDDDAYVTDNPVLNDGRGLLAAWTRLDATPQYYPLTHTSLFLDHALWGTRPRGYHVVNVLLHASSAILLWRLLGMLRLPGAFLAGVLFAVHPVHVESVAWVTERKNTLSCLLALGAAFQFLRPDPRRGWAAVLYAGALLAKTVTATLPIVLALVLWFRRGKVSRIEAAWLAPMLAAGAVLGAITRHLEATQLGASGGTWALTFAERTVLAGRIVWFYLGKLAAPLELIFVYPRWKVDASDPAAWIAPAAVVALAAALLVLSRRIGRGPFAAFAAFVVLLAPASGYFDVYPMRYAWVADHFQYMASIPVIALAAACAARHLRGHLALLGTVALVAVFGARAFAHARVFHDEETLWRRTLARNPAAWIAHNNLGILLATRGEAAEAEAHFRRVLVLEPSHSGALANLGYLLDLAGRDAEAAETLSRAAAVRGDDADVRAHLTRVLLRLGRMDEALRYAVEAARLRPDDPEILCDAGTLLASRGRSAEGIPLLERALALSPGLDRARQNLARARRDAADALSSPR